jgi:hypothetical protein
MKISDKSTSEAAEIVGNFVNKVLQDFESIALGKDSSLFYKVAFVLLLTSIAGRLTDLITLVYTSKFPYRFTFYRYKYTEHLYKNPKLELQCENVML